MKRKETCLALSIVLILFFSIGQYVIAVENIDDGTDMNAKIATDSPFESVTEAYDFLGSENELSPFDYDSGARIYETDSDTYEEQQQKINEYYQSNMYSNIETML